MMHLHLFMTWERLIAALQLRAGSVLHDGEVSAGPAKAHLRLSLREDVQISSDGTEVITEAVVQVLLQPREHSLFSGEWIRDRVSVQLDLVARFFTRIEWQPDWKIVSHTRWQLDRETGPSGIMDKSAMALLRSLADAQMDALAAQVDQTLADLPVDQHLREAWRLVFHPFILDIGEAATLWLRPLPESLRVSPVFLSEEKGHIELEAALRPRLYIGQTDTPADAPPAFPAYHAVELPVAPTLVEAEVCLSYQALAQRLAGLAFADNYGQYALEECSFRLQNGQLRMEATATARLSRWQGASLSGRLGLLMDISVENGQPQLLLRSLFTNSRNLAVRAAVALVGRGSLTAMEALVNQEVNKEWEAARQQAIFALSELIPIPGLKLRCEIASLRLLSCAAGEEGIVANVQLEGSATAELDPSAFYR
ncbi:MAG: DUF4403 family protein [Bacteroidetes bacterium]|nr:MAG: DUF4403 family protein [Bacteroidota bacterium]